MALVGEGSVPVKTDGLSEWMTFEEHQDVTDRVLGAYDQVLHQQLVKFRDHLWHQQARLHREATRVKASTIQREDRDKPPKPAPPPPTHQTANQPPTPPSVSTPNSIDELLHRTPKQTSLTSKPISAVLLEANLQRTHQAMFRINEQLSAPTIQPNRKLSAMSSNHAAHVVERATENNVRAVPTTKLAKTPDQWAAPIPPRKAVVHEEKPVTPLEEALSKKHSAPIPRTRRSTGSNSFPKHKQHATPLSSQPPRRKSTSAKVLTLAAQVDQVLREDPELQKLKAEHAALVRAVDKLQSDAAAIGMNHQQISDVVRRGTSQRFTEFVAVEIAKLATEAEMEESNGSMPLTPAGQSSPSPIPSPDREPRETSLSHDGDSLSRTALPPVMHGSLESSMVGDSAPGAEQKATKKKHRHVRKGDHGPKKSHASRSPRALSHSSSSRHATAALLMDDLSHYYVPRYPDIAAFRRMLDEASRKVEGLVEGLPSSEIEALGDEIKMARAAVSSGRQTLLHLEQEAEEYDEFTLKLERTARVELREAEQTEMRLKMQLAGAEKAANTAAQALIKKLEAKQTAKKAKRGLQFVVSTESSSEESEEDDPIAVHHANVEVQARLDGPAREKVDAARRFIHRLSVREHTISDLLERMSATLRRMDSLGQGFESAVTCPQCEAPSNDMYALWPCGHTFCHRCIQTAQEHVEGATMCPICQVVSSDMPVPNGVVNAVSARVGFKQAGYQDLLESLSVFLSESSNVDTQFYKATAWQYHQHGEEDEYHAVGDRYYMDDD